MLFPYLHARRTAPPLTRRRHGRVPIILRRDNPALIHGRDRRVRTRPRDRPTGEDVSQRIARRGCERSRSLALTVPQLEL